MHDDTLAPTIRKRKAMRGTLWLGLFFLVVAAMNGYNHYLGLQEVCEVDHCYSHVAQLGSATTGLFLLFATFAGVYYFVQRKMPITDF